ncbi:uncharacterized protein EMPS_02689 [Entomortierella parvispora]|uniref:VPS9 domain-containing protein n=1 Tax=Entomortierella parvispora TaxID=205924 RepID=A0A9P3H5F7_9FUNG|nr:uncharacterized protein EMPS_02689 [Entomortierella parvispora]
MDLALSHFQPAPASSPMMRMQRPMPSTTSNHLLSLLFFHESTSLPTASLIPPEQLKSFQFLRRAFEASLNALVRDRVRNQLVVLCPVQPALMGKDALKGLEWEWGGIDEEFILSHIVRVPGRDHPVAKGLTVTTLNGRSLILTDTTVTTAKGFKLLKQARLVSEKIFYDNEGRGWVVQFIDRPLVGKTQKDGSQSSSTPGSPKAVDSESGQNRISSPLSSTSEPSYPLHPQESSSRVYRRSKQRPAYKYGMTPYREARRRKQGRPQLTLQLVLQRFPGVPQKLEQLIMGFNDEAMFKNSLDEIRVSVDRLLTDSVELLNQVDPTVLSALLDEYGANVQVLDQLLENYIMNSTYDIIFFKINSHLKQQDWDLAEAIRELRNLDLGQVGLPDTQQHFQCLVSALNEFQSIGVLRTPEEKLACLVKSVRVTSSLSGGADDLIPVLLLTVLRSGISNLASNLYYMKNFVLFGDTTRGEYGYSLSTLEAVARYILSHSRQLSPLSSMNQKYWEDVCSGNLAGIQQICEDQSNSADTKTAPPAPALIRRHSAASVGSESDISIHSLLQNSSPVQSRDAEGNNGVLLACRSVQLDVLRYLLETKGHSADVANYEGRTPLMQAVLLENLEMVRLLLEYLKEADAVNKQDVLGNTAMHLCASTANMDLMNELLKANPDLGRPNNEGNTPLLIATKASDGGANHLTVVSLIAAKMTASDMDRRNNDGDTALHFIVVPGLIKELVDLGANPELENYAGWTPLLKWALHDNTEVVKCLLQTGRVDALMTDSRGYTPLHMACLRGNVEMAQMLETHTPIDMQSVVDGSTPLQLACQSGSLTVVEFLLEKGADPELRDWANESAVDMTNDNAILDILDNSMLFWVNKGEDGNPPPSDGQGSNEKITESLAPSGKRVIRVVRGTMENDGKVRYIVKSGSTTDASTIVTMSRSLEDFRFLRESLLVESPDACIPSLESFYSPYLLLPSRPSKTVLSISARRLDMFLKYLSNHPVLSNHELLWEFVLMPELQREMISERSIRKQESHIDSIFDNFPQIVEQLDHEEMYFKYLKEQIVRLEAAVQQARKCSRKLSRSQQDVPQQLDILARVFDDADQINFTNKTEYIQALKSISSTQTTMHTSDIESLGNLFEDFSFVIDGTLKALQHPQEIVDSIRQLRASAIKVEQSIRRSENWWSGLSTIGEGALTAFGGAGAALGAVGHAASSTFEVVSGTLVPGNGGSSSGGSQHARAVSEGQRPTRAASSPPASMASSPPRQSRKMASSGGGSGFLTPIQPRAKTFQEPSASSLSPASSPSARMFSTSSSLLTSPFSSIAAVASAATGQVSQEEIQDKIGKASSLLNSLHGSLFEELTHLQNHHTKELSRAMRDFGARQLQIERSRLRDMMEILSDLRVETSTPSHNLTTQNSNDPTTPGGIAMGGSVSRGISRHPSIHALVSTVASTTTTPFGWEEGTGGGSPFENVLEDEKEEARMLYRQHELQRSRSRSIHSNHDSPILDRYTGPRSKDAKKEKEEDELSEKIPFDD